LAEPAMRDESTPATSVAKRLEVAGAWQLAQANLSDRDDKLAAQRREKWLLTQVLASVEGLDRVKVVQRLDDLKDISASRARPGSRGSMPYVSLIGRIMSGNNDVNIVVSYENGYQITRDDFARLRKLANMGNDPLRVELVGMFDLSTPQELRIRHVGLAIGANESKTFKLFIDGRSTASANRPPGENSIVGLAAGPHVVGWLWEGMGFELAQLEIKFAPPKGNTTGPFVAMEVDHKIETVARRTPVRGTIHFGPSRK
jgi:hypothetical protein